MSAPVGCWYCHAVAIDLCLRCGMTEKEREEERRFYESFKPVPMKPKKKEVTSDEG